QGRNSPGDAVVVVNNWLSIVGTVVSGCAIVVADSEMSMSVQLENDTSNRMCRNALAIEQIDI
ncbi:MAG: hypothetical protein ACRDDF_11085, partial [Aeromonas sp.]